MTMEGDVMRMRALDGLDLPAGQTVELKPGGLHLMFQQLKAHRGHQGNTAAARKRLKNQAGMARVATATAKV